MKKLICRIWGHKRVFLPVSGVYCLRCGKLIGGKVVSWNRNKPS